MFQLSCVFTITFTACLSIALTLYCSDYENRIKHEYHPLRHCQRSNKTVIAFENVRSVHECAAFARVNHGLAFNFGPKERGEHNLFDDVTKKDNKRANHSINHDDTIRESKIFYNCQILDCPEFLNFSMMINDTRFDYYSLYANTAPPSNSTCLPSIGVFTLQNTPRNYSMAQRFCKIQNSVLAHVLSYKRTNQISQMLEYKEQLESPIEVAFVGLRETDENRFFNSNNESMDCFRFRAWAPRHPSKTHLPGCVAITLEQSWKVYNCQKKLPFICEVLSSGPNNQVNLDRQCSVKLPNNRLAPKRDDLSA